MDKNEPLCDLRFLTAEYKAAKPKDQSHESHFQIGIRPSDRGPLQFDVDEKNGEQFAAELDVLAAIIRARVIRARLRGEERDEGSEP